MSMICLKCGGRSFYPDDGDMVCWACRRSYGQVATEPQQPKRPRFTWAERRRAVELSGRIGVAEAAREFGVAESTIYDWRSEMERNLRALT